MKYPSVVYPISAITLIGFLHFQPAVPLHRLAALGQHCRVPIVPQAM